MSRLLAIAPELRNAGQNEVVERLTAGRGRVPTPYQVWLHSPDVAAGMEHVGTYLNKRSALSVREVEMAIIIIARHWSCDYVIRAHLRLGREAGLPEDVLEGLRDGTPLSLSDAHEQAVYDFAIATVSGDDLPDAEFDRLERILTRCGIADLLVLLGYYSSVSLAMRAHKVEPR